MREERTLVVRKKKQRLKLSLDREDSYKTRGEGSNLLYYECNRNVRFAGVSAFTDFHEIKKPP